MIGREPRRSWQSYRHEAFFWHSQSDFLTALIPFVEEGLGADEPVLIAAVPEHTEWIRDALAGASNAAHFVDMTELGRNPAQIIPRLQRFLSRSGSTRPVRAIGEPIQPDRRPEELVEGQLHEALLNVAVDPETPLWLICPYDARRLGGSVIDEALHSHPAVIDAGSYRGSANYAGRVHAESLFRADLDEIDPRSRLVDVDVRSVDRLGTYLKLELYVIGLSIERAAGLAQALQLLGSESLRRGATRGRIGIWTRPGALICEVSDDAVVEDVLLGRRPTPETEVDAFGRAHEVGDLVQVRSSLAGTRVRIHTWT